MRVEIDEPSYFPTDLVDDFLSHYGVKGMRWGVIRENLKTSRQARREKRAGKFDRKAATLNARISATDSKVATNFIARRNKAKKLGSLIKERDRALADAQAKRDGKLSRNQKRIVVGAAVVGTLIAAHATYQAGQTGELNRLTMRGKQFVEGRDTLFKKNDKFADKNLDADGIYKNVVDGINPDYGSWGTKVNCRRATYTYEMRRRGYDVTATRTSSGKGQTKYGVYNASTFSKPVPNSMPLFVKRAMSDPKVKEFGKKASVAGTEFIMPEGGSYGKSIFDTLAKQPNGARGELGMIWKAGGGHSMAWEIVKGKPVIFDTQSGQMFKDFASFAANADAMESAGFNRLDNVKLNENFLARWMKDA